MFKNHPPVINYLDVRREEASGVCDFEELNGLLVNELISEKVVIMSLQEQELKLHSPAGGDPMLYTWPLSSFGSGKVRDIFTLLFILISINYFYTFIKHSFKYLQDRIDGGHEIAETIK
jgi:hypothetical protein